MPGAQLRLFQNCGVYSEYRRLFHSAHGHLGSFADLRDAYLEDRYGAVHYLKPVLDRDPRAFFTNGDDPALQALWARDHGLDRRASLEEILLAQIEEHGAECFYNTDPMRFGSSFVRRLPGCVRSTACWRAAPSPGADFSAYDVIFSNFPSIIRSWRDRGWRAECLYPAYDPAMDGYGANVDRPIDVLFVGGYSRHHERRARVLRAVASLSPHRKVAYHLDISRLTRLANTPVGLIPGLSRHRIPSAIASIREPPVFGRDLYERISRTKVVLNGAIDMAGEDRGNMRCFEALGCGALMVSDEGRYPDGFVNARTMLTYGAVEEAARLIDGALERWDTSGRDMAASGWQMVRERYSKEKQYQSFLLALS
jgi:hypothetical protein